MKDPEIPEYSYARRREQPAVDPALKRIAILAGAASLLVIVVALAWSGLRPRFGFGGAPPVIAAPLTPLRVAPAQPGGLTVPGANEQIMSGQTPNAPPILAPPPPPPNLSALQQDAAERAAVARPAARAVAPAPAATPPPAVAAPAAGAGPVAVQLAATSTEAAAHKLWYTLSRARPELLAGARPVFIPVTVDGRPVVRLRVPGFADRAAAAKFCAALAAKGAACTVAAF